MSATSKATASSTTASTATAAAATSSVTWEGEVLTELLALQYVRAVVFTNGRGHTLRLNRRATIPEGLAKSADLALAALNQTGVALQLGRLDVSACVYQDGVVILSGSGALRVAVLAEAGANLGTLLNHVRRIFRQEAP